MKPGGDLIGVDSPDDRIAGRDHNGVTLRQSTSDRVAHRQAVDNLTRDGNRLALVARACQQAEDHRVHQERPALAEFGRRRRPFPGARRNQSPQDAGLVWNPALSRTPEKRSKLAGCAANLVEIVVAKSCLRIQDPDVCD